jgi:hypothetical protein
MERWACPVVARQYQLMEKEMPNNSLTIVGTLLLVASIEQVDGRTGRHVHEAESTLLDRQFFRSNNAVDGNALSARAPNASCQNREPGNPYNMQDDYQHWSSWRQLGAWDSHNDCW